VTSYSPAKAYECGKLPKICCTTLSSDSSIVLLMYIEKLCALLHCWISEENAGSEENVRMNVVVFIGSLRQLLG